MLLNFPPTQTPTGKQRQLQQQRQLAVQQTTPKNFFAVCDYGSVLFVIWPVIYSLNFVVNHFGLTVAS